MHFSYYTITGVLVGILVGITGVGGGSLMTPLLVLLFGFSPSVAVGTDLVFAAVTKSLGVLTHHGVHRSVDWRIAGRLSLGSIPGALLALAFLYIYSELGEDIALIIKPTLGAALILTSCAVLIRGYVNRLNSDLPRGLIRWLARSRRSLTIATGFILGALVTISSVGAGALGTIVILALYPNLSALRVVGTDLAYAIPLASVAGLGHIALGAVDWWLLLGLLSGSLPGIWLGSRISALIPERILRSFLALVLLLVALKCFAV